MILTLSKGSIKVRKLIIVCLNAIVMIYLDLLF